VAEALRLAAQSPWQAKNYFGELYRRWRARLGGPKAITAMAHKLAHPLASAQVQTALQPRSLPKGGAEDEKKEAGPPAKHGRQPELPTRAPAMKTNDLRG